ncbi:MAG: ChbG/HpnK family deacetylase [Planctomycetota bacterium]|nr:ChbG/HpnK family deacetylase [Planctomycetota bacterium]
MNRTPRPTQSLVFHADDLGFTHGFTDAIHRAHRHGNVTSTSIQSIGIAYDYARRNVLPDCPGLGIGVHLNVVECRGLRPARRQSDLVDADGCFRGYGPLLRAALSRRIRQQIVDECTAQIEKAASDGIAIDHLNSHRHVHMLPWLFDPICEHADRYGIPFIRVVRERFHSFGTRSGIARLLRDCNVAKQSVMSACAARASSRLRHHDVRANQRFIGISFTGFGSESAITAALAANRAETVELLLHPCVRRHSLDHGRLSPSIRRYCDAPSRAIELAAACSMALAKKIRDMGFATTNYAALADRMRKHATVRQRDGGTRTKNTIAAARASALSTHAATI